MGCSLFASPLILTTYGVASVQALLGIEDDVRSARQVTSDVRERSGFCFGYLKAGATLLASAARSGLNPPPATAGSWRSLNHG
jgi:hypothetical protein